MKTPLAAVIDLLPYTRDRDSIIRIVVRATRQISGADGASFVLRESHECFYADEDAIAPLWKGQRFPASACISGWAMIFGKVAVVEDVMTDPRIPTEAYKPTFVRSLVMVPVRQSAPVAAIGAYWKTKHKADEQTVNLLSTLAQHAAAALAAAQE
jgi:GAF domain-containing protein